MATLTITTTPEEDLRSASAFGALLNPLGGKASEAQVKAYLIDCMRTVVQNYERDQRRKAIPEPVAFDPT